MSTGAVSAQALEYGTPAGEAEFGYYVSVNGQCGGAMVDAEWVLTTKSCTPAGDASGVSLTAKTSAGPVALRGLVSHYAPKGDAVLIQVERNTTVPTVQLPEDLPSDGGVLTVVAGGSGRLIQGQFEVDGQEYPYDFFARSRQGTAVCDGDKGSPAVVRTQAGDRLVGLVRGAYAPCAPFGTAQFSKLGAPATLTWMRTTVSQSQPNLGGKYVIINKNSGKALDVNAAGEIIQATRTDSARQTWVFNKDTSAVPLPSPHAYPLNMKNAASGQLLGIVGGALGDGARAVEFPDVDVPDQSWSFVPGDGYYTIVNNNSGKVLGVPQSSLTEGEYTIQWTDIGVDDQKWLAVRIG